MSAYEVLNSKVFSRVLELVLVITIILLSLLICDRVYRYNKANNHAYNILTHDNYILKYEK